MTKQKKKEWYSSPGKIILVVFAVLILIPIVAASVNQATDPNNTPEAKQARAESDAKQQAEQAAQEAKAKAEHRKEFINTYGPIYCEGHKNVYMQNDPVLTDGGWPTFSGTRNWNQDECKTIITKLFDNGTSESRLIQIASGRKIGVDMNMYEVIYSLGYPNDINATTTSYGRSEQWVYGNPIYGANYVYLENGIVTSYQN